jgi:hypothetical protein
MSFSGRVTLARHIEPDKRTGTFVHHNAFMLSSVDLQTRKPYLSVNSRQLQAIEEIIEIHRGRQRGKGEVAVAIHKVYRYVTQGRNAGAQIVPQLREKKWMFSDSDGDAPAFLHRPNEANISHCGVEFLRSLNELQQRDFARAMARHPGLQVFPAIVRRSRRR